MAARQAEWMVKQWKRSYPYTDASIEIMEAEVWKALREIPWDKLPSCNSPLMEVKDLTDKIPSRFGVYDAKKTGR